MVPPSSNGGNHNYTAAMFCFCLEKLSLGIKVHQLQIKCINMGEGQQNKSTLKVCGGTTVIKYLIQQQVQTLYNPR